MGTNQTRKFIAGALLICMVLFSICLVSCKPGNDAEDTAQSESQLSSLEPLEQPDAETETTAEPRGPVAGIFFASDYQIQSGWDTPGEQLSGILQAVAKDQKQLDEMVLCGDYTNDGHLNNHQLSSEDSIREIKDIAASYYPNITPEQMIFVQGNHDKLTESIASSGLHEYDEYLIYVLNTQEEFPWKQGTTSGSLKKVQDASAEMKSCFDALIKQGETRPVFIVGHVPLHYTARTSSLHKTGDNLYASLIFDVVNDAGESLDIVYVFGHNHSKGWDCYMGGSSVYKAKGDRVLIPEFKKSDRWTNRFSEQTLAFTYLNAGYVGYYSNYGPGESGSAEADQIVDQTLTGTVCEIYADKLVLSRYDAEGLHPIGGNGAADPYQGGIDKDLIHGSYYSHITDSPQTVSRKVRKAPADESQ